MGTGNKITSLLMDIGEDPRLMKEMYKVAARTIDAAEGESPPMETPDQSKAALIKMIYAAVTTCLKEGEEKFRKVLFAKAKPGQLAT